MKISIVALADPWAHSHGGTMRTRAFARAFVALGHTVSCIYPSTEMSADEVDGVERVPVAPSALGVREWPQWVRRVKRSLLPMPTQLGGRSQSLLDQVRIREPDVIVVSVLPYVWYADQVPQAALWLDHSDLYSDFIEREISSRRGLPRLAATRQQRHLLGVENRASAEAAITTTAGWRDSLLLAERVGRKVPWLPTPVTDRLSTVSHARSGRPPTAGFIANFAFWPNVDALRLLNESWAPRLIDMGWRVVVAGLGSDEVEVAPGIDVLGPVEHVRSFYDAVDVTLAPIRLGGGMKVKVVESLAYGRPVVATEFGMAGFPPDVADLVEVVDAETPSFDALVAGPPPVPPLASAVLRPFAQDGFTDAVDGMLATVR